MDYLHIWKVQPQLGNTGQICKWYSVDNQYVDNSETLKNLQWYCDVCLFSVVPGFKSDTGVYPRCVSLALTQDMLNKFGFECLVINKINHLFNFPVIQKPWILIARWYIAWYILIHFTQHYLNWLHRHICYVFWYKTWDVSIPKINGEKNYIAGDTHINYRNHVTLQDNIRGDHMRCNSNNTSVFVWRCK